MCRRRMSPGIPQQDVFEHFIRSLWCLLAQPGDRDPILLVLPQTQSTPRAGREIIREQVPDQFVVDLEKGNSDVCFPAVVALVDSVEEFSHGAVDDSGVFLGSADSVGFTASCRLSYTR